MSTKKVLVIDDDTSILEVIKVVLQEEGYIVETDNQGTYFDSPNPELPDLVLLDVLLSGLDGKTICKKIKADPALSKIPVIMISANSPREVEHAVKESGADGYITKPFDIYELLEIVKQYIFP